MVLENAGLTESSKIVSAEERYEWDKVTDFNLNQSFLWMALSLIVTACPRLWIRQIFLKTNEIEPRLSMYVESGISINDNRLLEVLVKVKNEFSGSGVGAKSGTENDSLLIFCMF